MEHAPGPASPQAPKPNPNPNPDPNPDPVPNPDPNPNPGISPHMIRVGMWACHLFMTPWGMSWPFGAWQANDPSGHVLTVSLEHVLTCLLGACPQQGPLGCVVGMLPHMTPFLLLPPSPPLLLSPSPPLSLSTSLPLRLRLFAGFRSFSLW